MQIPEPLNSRFLVLSGCRVYNPISDSPCVAKILLEFPGENLFSFLLTLKIKQSFQHCGVAGVRKEPMKSNKQL